MIERRLISAVQTAQVSSMYTPYKAMTFSILTAIESLVCGKEELFTKLPRLLCVKERPAAEP